MFEYQIILLAEESGSLTVGWEDAGIIGLLLIAVIGLVKYIKERDKDDREAHAEEVSELKGRYENCEKEHKETRGELLLLTGKVNKVEGQFEGLTKGIEQHESWLKHEFRTLGDSVDQLTEALMSEDESKRESENK